MSLTRSAWSVKTVYRNGKKFIHGSCTVAQTASEQQAFTQAITFLDPSKKFGVFANTRASSGLDGSTLPVDILGTAYTVKDYPSMDCVESSSNTILTSNGASSGSQIGGIIKASFMAAVEAAQGFAVYDPKNTAAHAEMPTLYLNLDGAGALAAKTCYWNVIQLVD